MLELSLTNSVPIEDDTLWLGSDRLIELDQHVLNHRLHALNHRAVNLLPVCLLDTDLGSVSAGELVHAADQGRHTRSTAFTCTEK